MERPKQTICWDCANSVGDCSWSEKLEVVYGSVVIENKNGIMILSCPKFVRNCYGYGMYRDKEKWEKIERKYCVNRH